MSDEMRQAFEKWLAEPRMFTVCKTSAWRSWQAACAYARSRPLPPAPEQKETKIG